MGRLEVVRLEREMNLGELDWVELDLGFVGCGVAWRGVR